LAERFGVGEMFARESFVDDDDWFRADGVGLVKSTSAQQRHFHH
jgi:hypothetical protein